MKIMYDLNSLLATGEFLAERNSQLWDSPSDVCTAIKRDMVHGARCGYLQSATGGYTLTFSDEDTYIGVSIHVNPGIGKYVFVEEEV